MAWNDLTFNFGAILTSSQMTQLDDNFDAMANGDAGAPPITQGGIGAGAVHQSELDTSVGSVSSSSSSDTTLTLPGGSYGFYPQFRGAFVFTDAYVQMVATDLGISTGFTTHVTIRSPDGVDIYAQQRYINASAPFDLGDGEVQNFTFLLMNADGSINSTYIAPTPPWIYNGSHSVVGKPHDDGKNGKQYGRHVRDVQKLARSSGKTLIDLIKEGLLDEEKLAASPKVFEKIEPLDKNVDMAEIPHPFSGQTDTSRIVLLDPMSSLNGMINELQQVGEDVVDLVTNYLVIDNDHNGRSSSPNVKPVNFRLKNSKVKK